MGVCKTIFQVILLKVIPLKKAKLKKRKYLGKTAMFSRTRLFRPSSIATKPRSGSPGSAFRLGKG